MLSHSNLPDTFEGVSLDFVASTTCKGATVAVEQTFRIVYDGATLERALQLAAREAIITEQARIRVRGTDWQEANPVVTVRIADVATRVRTASAESTNKQVLALAKKAKAGKLTSTDLAAADKADRLALFTLLQESLVGEIEMADNEGGL
jgi:hypothetical protein